MFTPLHLSGLKDGSGQVSNYSKFIFRFLRKEAELAFVNSVVQKDSSTRTWHERTRLLGRGTKGLDYSDVARKDSPTRTWHERTRLLGRGTKGLDYEFI